MQIFIHSIKVTGALEFPSRCSGNKSNQEPQGCRFNFWPRSVGYGSGDALSCAGHRLGLDPKWLWHRPMATAPIRPLAWESPYAAVAAQEMAKKKKRQKTKKKSNAWHIIRAGYVFATMIIMASVYNFLLSIFQLECKFQKRPCLPCLFTPNA